MHFTMPLPAPVFADAANSFWHEALVFGIATVSFIIIMAHAIRGRSRRRSLRQPSTPLV